MGVVLFVQLLPRLLHFDLHKEARAMHAKQEASIISRLVRVNQPNLLGQNIADCKLLDGLHCMVTRVVRDGRLMPLTPEDTFREGTEVLIVGNSDTMPHDIAFLGEACENPYPMDSQKERPQADPDQQGLCGTQAPRPENPPYGRRHHLPHLPAGVHLCPHGRHDAGTKRRAHRRRFARKTSPNTGKKSDTAART